MMTMAIYEAVFYYLRLKKSIRREEESKRAIVQAQLDVLRNQSQPHFFFNSLNTLRDIIDHNSKEEAKTFVDKLAEVYRFVLQTGKQNVIPLADEIEFAKAYVHIQKERFGENLQVEWGVLDGLSKDGVVPTSLQLLIENAIKHNVVSKSKPLTVRVYAQKGHLVVENRLQPKSTRISSTRLGLKNLKQRYDLLASEPLRIDQTDEHFQVSLPLLSPQTAVL
jgi:LytS/YehU family sensor histidine kinase